MLPLTRPLIPPLILPLTRTLILTLTLILPLPLPLPLTQAGKITGMLLELDDAELLELLRPADVVAGAAALLEQVSEM